MKKIYLIRHGETEFNRQGIIQGRGVDSDLNANGKAQAAAFYEYYQRVPFDAIYTSTLKRTHQTAGKFIEEGISWKQLSGLDEVSWGIKEGKHTSEVDNEQYANMIFAWKNGDYNAKVPEGESPLEVQARQKVAWDVIMRNVEESCILVCMHGRAIKILLSLLTNTPLSQMDNFPHQNVGLYVLRFEDGEYHIECENDSKHLEKLQLQKRA